jgi:NAD/NADP transhydrogenase beta subunit
MKTLIAIIHILIGLVLIFIITSPMDIYNKIQNPQNYWPDYSTSQIVIKDVVGIILGIISIVGAVALMRNKRWATFILPMMMLILAVLVFVSALNTYSLVAGPAILFALIFFLFFITETVYWVFKNRYDPSTS